VRLTRWLRARLFRFLGLRALRSHRVNSALENFQRAAEQEPENVHTTILMADCLNRLENYEAALEKCEQALKRAPNYAGARAERALALAGVGRPQQAIDELRRAQRIGLNARDDAQDSGRVDWEPGSPSLVMTLKRSSRWYAR
jgi:tetratricopeptide (TPR) repeat protein